MSSMSVERIESVCVIVKIEPDLPEYEPRAESPSVSEPAARDSLYADHKIKQELVVGPELLQKSDTVYNLQDNHIKKEGQLQTKLHIKEEPKEIKREQCSSNEEPEPESEPEPSKTWLEIEIDTGTDITKVCADKPLTEKKDTTTDTKKSDLKPKGNKKNKIDKTRYKCSHCKHTSATKKELRNHERIHTSDVCFQCNHCSYLSTSQKGLTVHERKHFGEKPFKCDHCSYATAKKWALLVHEKKHNGEKPYKCSHCSYRCAKKGDLTHHERIHTGEKPYKCDLCSHATAHKDALQVHKRKMHTGDNPFKCSHCSYSSAKKNHLTAHIKIHAVEKT